MSKQFDKAEKICNEGLNLDPSEILLQLQLAHIYLFTERLDLAKVIHSKYKNQNINASTNWKTQTENDFLLFEKYNFPNHDFKKIIRIVD
jgi:predicted Zn-dependent protease